MAYETSNTPEQHNAPLERRQKLDYSLGLIANAMVRNYLQAVHTAMQTGDSDAIQLGQQYGMRVPASAENPSALSEQAAPISAVIENSVSLDQSGFEQETTNAAA